MEDLLGLSLSIFFGFAPVLFFAWIVYWLDRYEKEPGILLGGVFVWGAVIAAGAAFMINTTLGLGVDPGKARHVRYAGTVQAFRHCRKEDLAKHRIAH